MPLSRSRKLLFALLTTIAAVVAVEGSARLYNAARWHHPGALGYGFAYVGRLLTGGVPRPATSDSDAALAEEVDRLFARRADADDGFVPGPPTTVIIAHHTARINSLGFRGPEVPREPAPGKRRIGAFGGSFVFGDVLADDEAWPYVLGQLMDARGLPFEVVNAGGRGMNIHHVLQSVIRLTNRARIDYVLVTSAYNNHALLPRERRDSMLVRADEFFYNISMFYVMFREKLGRERGEPLDYGLYRRQMHVDAAAVEQLVAMYRGRLEQLAAVCGERGATLIMASQAEEFYDARLNAMNLLDVAAVDAIGQQIARGETVWRQELEYYLQGRLNLEAQRFAQSTPGVKFFDGARVLQGDKSRLFQDWIHPSPLGARMLAEALADYFAREIAPSVASTPPNHG